ncbi:uncharacterized protein LOC101719920 isoform X3 [Heterocephalus glaber]|uniref:Uncharacterized protein LOC101719920 isoform X3 n=1 Tax=Heterocephalus glaber TaxID=10181 RepID=A0AAX6RP47_HETGA|nr:uncharacterized protein LOC101719920 isoform X3 [Heterocephalus glaber]
MSPFALLMRNTTTNRPAEHKLPWVTHVGAEGQQYCLGKALKDILFPGGERNKAWAVSVSSSLSQGPRMNLMGNLLDLTLQILPTLLLGCNLDEWKRCFIATTCGPELWDIPVLSAFQPCQDLASVFHEKSSVLFT